MGDSLPEASMATIVMCLLQEDIEGSVVKGAFSCGGLVF
jgi:hypothetical protein